MNNFLKTLKSNWWILFLILFSLLSLISEINSGRWSMIDLEVYYRTAQRMFSGEELYQIVSDGHYVYKYAPTAAILFMPLAIFPFWLAKTIYWCGLTFLLGLILHKYNTLVISEASNKAILTKNAIILALLTILIHLHSELHLGQINLPLLVIYVFVIFSIRINKQVLSAFLIAASIFIKPFGLIFLPYLLLKKQYKTLLYFAGSMLILLLLPLIFYPSFESFLALNKAWINELAIELGSKQNLFEKANHTIFSILARYTPLRFVLTSLVSQKIFQLVLLGIIGWLFYLLEKRKKSMLMEMSVLIILIPLFAFTSKNAFLFTMPLAFYLISHFRENTKTVKTLTILGCVFIGGNLYEIYGPEFSMFLTDISIYGIGSIILLVANFIATKNSTKNYRNLNAGLLNSKQ